MRQSIKNWIEEDRPREKLMHCGASALSPTELLAILIQSGTKEKSALDVARGLLGTASGRLGRLARHSLKDLTANDGIGPARAVALMAAFEIGRRMAAEAPEDEVQVRGTRDAASLMSSRLGSLDHEECWVVYLNRANGFMGREKISSGGVSATVMDVKIIVKKAVERLASGIILYHNHPSGNPRPGQADIEQTDSLRRAAATLDIKLVDHIIIAGKKYFSFSEEFPNLVLP